MARNRHHHRKRTLEHIRAIRELRRRAARLTGSGLRSLAIAHFAKGHSATTSRPLVLLVEHGFEAPAETRLDRLRLELEYELHVPVLMCDIWGDDSRVAAELLPGAQPVF